MHASSCSKTIVGGTHDSAIIPNGQFCGKVKTEISNNQVKISQSTKKQSAQTQDKCALFVLCQKLSNIFILYSPRSGFKFCAESETKCEKNNISLAFIERCDFNRTNFN